MKAITLLSGGLDSILAARLILDQGIEVEAVNFLTVFCNCTARGKTCLASKSAADQLGIKLKVFEISDEYFEIIKEPKYGYGRNMNPCLDCRIFMFKKAREYMRETGALFVITGEVLGERPMSQRRDAMRIIERDSGLKGLIVRPLSAKSFEPSVPEVEGWVDREKFLGIKGRSRKPQIQLASRLEINDYPCPAGGCLLTDSGFARRMRDLMYHQSDFDINDVRLLKVGRHFRLTKEAKIMVGRDEEENNRLLSLASRNDLCFHPVKIKGPVGVGKGVFGRDSLDRASRIIARYSDIDSNRQIRVCYRTAQDKVGEFVTVLPAEKSELDRLRI
ncbi:MAG: hypothetical protein PVH45_03945 [Candidatus Omnitrophota bacterium]|jgi:hypothetical protein